MPTKRRREFFLRYDAGCPLWGPDLRDLGLRIWNEKHPTEKQIERHFAVARKVVSQTISFHSLRHAFGSYCVMMGESLTDVAAWMHHASQSTTEDYYVHLAPRGRARMGANREIVLYMRSHCMAKAMTTSMTKTP